MIRTLGWWVASLMLVSGCEGKQRDFVSIEELTADSGSPGTGGAGPGAGSQGGDDGQLPGGLQRDPSAALPPGSPCVDARECGSGTCADGVCCRTSCDTVCTRCDAPGQEGECVVTANDSACDVSCPEATECRSYGSSALTANCEAAGSCRAAVECAATDTAAGTVCEEGTGLCDGLGECVVAGKKRLGEACGADTECGQGNCVIGSSGAAICCDAQCDGLCRTCSDTGRCEETPRDDARCPGVDCPDDDLCRDYADDLTVNLCRGFGACRSQVDCSFEELRSGAECACGPEGCRLTLGAACASVADCASGACEGTAAGTPVCCALGCAEAGSVCAADGSRCLACEGSSAECQDGSVSRRCAADSLTLEACGNGCDTATGGCTALRLGGTGCETAAQCESGACTVDVTGSSRCCDPSCEASGRVCGTDGTCVCPSDSQEVDGTCLRAPGQSCVSGAECASAACAPTVSGASVCCSTACTGSFCASDGTSCVECEGAGATCAGNVSQRCQDEALILTTCGTGCDATNGVCNGLLGNGQACNANNQCATNLCSPDVSNVSRCCTPNCAASGRVCGTDGACVCADPSDVFIRGACRSVEGESCAADGDCRSNACESTQSGGQVCCSGDCNGQLCRGTGQGCVQCEGGAPTCQGNSSRACVNDAFVSVACGNGCDPRTGACNGLIAQGGTGCGQAAQCAGNGSSCQNGRCCEFDCAAAGRVCDNTGICRCPAGSTAVGNACLLNQGQTCERADQCASGRCDPWFRDLDGDLHGDPAQVSRICGTASSPAPTGFVPSNDDCCDTDPDTNPDAVFDISNLALTLPNACGSFDRNCDNAITNTGQVNIDRGFTRCDQVPFALCGNIIWNDDPNDVFADPNSIPECGKVGNFTACGTSLMGVALTACAGITGGDLVNRCL
jgi:hypothetical protein